eukprot:gb/GECH01007320.1/.p1 GENE.gb/GECH01007320.1/~~gb/GECH01007320.1/.p1  ORF type:complete len:545 (+),score=134.08 gb/GECH01007320.1/:1-1635(+)
MKRNIQKTDEIPNKKQRLNENQFKPKLKENKASPRCQNQNEEAKEKSLSLNTNDYNSNSNSQHHLSISDLSIDTYGHVFSFLDISELFRSRRICSELNYHFEENLRLMGHINFSDRSVSPPALKQISNCIHLHTLNLNKTKNVSRATLINIVSNCKDLKRLYLNQCPRMNTRAVNAILLKCKTSKRMNHNNNNLNNNNDNNTIEENNKINNNDNNKNQNGSSLTHLSLSGCDRITAEVLTGIKAHGPTLTYLDLSFSSFPPKQLKCLQIICPNLTYLNVAGIPAAGDSFSMQNRNNHFETQFLAQIRKETQDQDQQHESSSPSFTPSETHSSKYLKTLNVSHGTANLARIFSMQIDWRTIGTLHANHSRSIGLDEFFQSQQANSFCDLKEISLVNTLRDVRTLDCILHACPKGLIYADFSQCNLNPGSLMKFIKHHSETLEELHLFSVDLNKDVLRTVRSYCKKLRKLTFVGEYRFYDAFIMNSPRSTPLTDLDDIQDELPDLELIRFSSYASGYSKKTNAMLESGLISLHNPREKCPTLENSL